MNSIIASVTSQSDKTYGRGERIEIEQAKEICQGHRASRFQVWYKKHVLDDAVEVHCKEMSSVEFHELVLRQAIRERCPELLGQLAVVLGLTGEEAGNKVRRQYDSLASNSWLAPHGK